MKINYRIYTGLFAGLACAAIGVGLGLGIYTGRASEREKPSNESKMVKDVDLNGDSLPDLQIGDDLFINTGRGFAPANDYFNEFYVRRK